MAKNTTRKITSSLRTKRAKEIVGTITLAMLDIICTIPEALIGAFLHQNDVLKKMESFDGEFNSSLLNCLNNLIKSGYIERQVINGNKSIRLTTKGKIKTMESVSNCQTDGKNRYISYDIPETMTRERDQFRRTLKRIGFRKLQKSLLVCPYVKADQIDLVIDELKIRPYVAYLVVNRTNIDEFVNKLFDHENM